MKELIRLRVQYTSRQQCSKTHKRPLPFFFTLVQLQSVTAGQALQLHGTAVNYLFFLQHINAASNKMTPVHLGLNHTNSKPDGLQNRHANLLLADTCGAVVAGPTHPATLFPILQCVFPQFNTYLSLSAGGTCSVFYSVCAFFLTWCQKYKRWLQNMFVPPFSYERGWLRDDGGLNRLFFTFLFCDMALAIRFLQDVKLIRSEVLCETCEHFISPRTEVRFRVGCG